MAVKALINKQYKAIQQAYERMSNIQELGVQKYTHTYIIRKLSERFYKSPKTIENIIYGRVS